MWNVIYVGGQSGYMTKTIDYQYNSQNQDTLLTYQATGQVEPDYMVYYNRYDNAGRLSEIQAYKDGSSGLTNFATYGYNQNSQVAGLNFQGDLVYSSYSYNSRNWIFDYAAQDLFSYTLGYLANGNIQTQNLDGNYHNGFTVHTPLYFTYSYDESNRLLGADETSYSDSTYSLANFYDKDGNIVGIRRYGNNNSLLDDFNYEYYSNTNRLKKVSGSSDQYTYDYNGNMLSDLVEGNKNLLYDHRNLMTYLKNGIGHQIYYHYDEAGNRIQKINSADNVNEIYIRGVDGREIAVYDVTTLKHWNVYGNDLIGKIDADTKRFYYLKDHLGSIRAIVDENRTLTSAQDYDAWGYLMQDRMYQSDGSIYKFTGKERDNESTYDYFGARYYDSRIARWFSMEPKYESSLSLSAYQYGNLNPLVIADINGKDGILTITGENTLRIDININYLTEQFDKENGFNSNEISVLESFKSNIQAYWSGSFQINGTTYQVTTNVNLTPLEMEFNQAITYVQRQLGENLAYRVNDPGEISGDMGVAAGGAIMKLLRSGEGLHPYESTGPHEVGHLLGLPDRGYAPKGTKPTIMHWANVNEKTGEVIRSRPGSSDFQEFMNKQDFILREKSNVSEKMILRGVTP